jgi:lysozyme
MVETVAQFEGLRLAAYRDSVGVWTIGYGHTAGVSSDDVISPAQADNFLRQDLEWADRAVLGATPNLYLSPSRHAALVSLCFNIGATAYKTSTCVRRMRGGDWLGAAEALTWFRKGRVNGKLVVIPGLVRRREMERTLFMEGSMVGSAVVEDPGPITGGNPKPMVKSKTAWLSLTGVMGSMMAAWSQLRVGAPEIIDMILPYLPYLLGVVFLAVMFNRWLDSRK